MDVVVVHVVFVEVFDEHSCEVFGLPVSGFEAFDVTVGNEATVKNQELVEFLVHSVDVFMFDDFFEVSGDGYHLLFLLFSLSFLWMGWIELLQPESELKGLVSFFIGIYLRRISSLESCGRMFSISGWK